MSAKETYYYGVWYGTPERDAMAIGWYSAKETYYYGV
jgi:hypothetical protein